MADKQITPFQLTDQFTMDNFNQRINETNIALQSKPNPNILDNPYFVNPVDQRGGYVYPPNSPYADISGNQIGATSKYLTIDVTKKNPSLAEWAEISIDGTTYYGYIPYAVRGYTGTGYGIDRWKIAYNPDSLSLLVTDSGLKVGSSITTGLFLGQWFEDGFAKGLINRICTVSLLFSDGTFVTGSGVFPEKDGVDATLINTNDVIVYLQYNASSQNKPCVVMVLKNASKAVFAAKLELGSQQTLAHQDENGNWVLNEIPNYAEELAKCQRYFTNIPYSIGRTISTAVSDGNGEAFFPIYFPTTMRVTPVFTHTGILRVHGPGIEYRDVSISTVTTQGNIVVLRVVGLSPLTTYALDSATGGVLNFSADL